MKKMLFLVVMIALMAGCGNGSNEPKEIPPELTSLVGSKWKLVGFFDIEKNELKEAEPKDCEECYTLDFITDSTFRGQSYSNLLLGSCNIHYETGKFDVINIGGTERGEIGHIYVETLWEVNSFTVEETYLRTLHLWYNNGKNYLKYNETGDNNEN